MQEGLVAPSANLARHEERQRGSETFAAHLGMGAYGRNFRPTRGLKALTRHRDQATVTAHTHVSAQLVRSRQKGTRLREPRQRQHLLDVSFAEFFDRGLVGRDKIVRDHLQGRGAIDLLPTPGRGWDLVAEQENRAPGTHELGQGLPRGRVEAFPPLRRSRPRARSATHLRPGRFRQNGPGGRGARTRRGCRAAWTRPRFREWTMPEATRFRHAIPGLAEHVAGSVNADGFAVVTGLLDLPTCQALIDEVDRVERDHDIDFGKNDFEGFHTRRIFNLIQRSPRFRDLVIHPTLLEMTERLLGVDFLLSGTTSDASGAWRNPAVASRRRRHDHPAATSRGHLDHHALGSHRFPRSQRSHTSCPRLSPPFRNATTGRKTRNDRRRDAGGKRARTARFHLARRRRQLNPGRRTLRTLHPVRGGLVPATTEPDARYRRRSRGLLSP